MIMNGKSGMTPLEIRNAIHKAGLNQAAIARAINKSPVSVSYVIDGKRNSRPIHEAIAEAIGKDIREIWPDLYMIPGQEPKRGRPMKTWHRKAA